MEASGEPRYTAFAGSRRIAAGTLADVAVAVKAVVDAGEREAVLVFDDVSSRRAELDLRGSVEEVLQRALQATPSPAESGDPAGDDVASGDAGGTQCPGVPRGRGRPRLGVVAREVTLLPRHWDWLATQPGGASVTLRKLVEAARRDGAGRERVRLARESAYRFMHELAGNEPGYEEAVRALYAEDGGAIARFRAQVAAWPADVREHALGLARVALGG